MNMFNCNIGMTAGRTFRMVLAAAVLIPSFQTPSQAAVAAQFNYQGKLADSGGTPQNGTFAMTFKIHDGAAVPYTYSRPSVTVTNGVFNVLVGDMSAPGATENPSGGLALALANAANPQLGVTVGAGAEMSPLQKLVSVPYALSVAAASITDNQIAASADIDPAKI
jgi:hypothetical protein